MHAPGAILGRSVLQTLQRLLPVLAALGAVAVLDATLGAAAHAQTAEKPIVIRLSVDNPDGLPRALMEKRFADLVKQKTNGRAVVQIFWSGSLGGVQRAAIEVVQNRGAEMAIISTSNFAAVQPAWMILDLPFLLKGREGYYKFFDGPVFAELKASAEKGARLKYVFSVFDGYRSLMTTKRPIKSPADMKGLKLRTTNSPIEVAYVRALGANPSPIDWGETYLALKQGLADGYFMGYTTILNFKHDDAIKYGLSLNVVPILVPAFMNVDFFNGLPADIQKAVLEAGRETDLANRKQDEADLLTAKQKLVAQGLVETVPTPAEMQTWTKLVQPVYEEFKGKLPAGMVQRALDSQQ